MVRTAIGLDIGGTRMRVARVDGNGAILDRRIIEGTRDPERAMALFEELIAACDAPEVEAIGIGVPGRVDAATGAVLSGGFLNLAGIDVAGRLGARFGRPVAIANDCSMALIGEARVGAARGAHNVVMLTIGTGIGGAALLDGVLVNGRRSAGQLGHIVVREGGLACVCGQAGCVEMYSSGTSFRRMAAERGLPADYRCEDALASAATDPRAAELLRDWAGPLRAAISTLSASFDPDVMLLGGGLGQSALAALAHAPGPGRWYDTPVRAAELGDDAGMIGAALLALDRACPAHPKGKRLVMVNGVPASGKSRVSAALSRRTGWPVLALDTVKNPFLAEFGTDPGLIDRLFNRRLGRASYQAIWDLIGEAPGGATFIVDAWFGFQPLEMLDEGIARAGISDVVEVWCSAPSAVVAERYRARLSARLSGHPGESYIPELIALNNRAAPAARGPVYHLDTTAVPDDDRLADWVQTAFRSGASAHEIDRLRGT